MKFSIFRFFVDLSLEFSQPLLVLFDLFPEIVFYWMLWMTLFFLTWVW